MPFQNIKYFTKNELLLSWSDALKIKAILHLVILLMVIWTLSVNEIYPVFPVLSANRWLGQNSLFL